MGAGYIKAKDKALENERQAARDKRDEGLYEMKKTEFDKGQADQAELKAVGSEQQTPSYTPDQGQQLDAVANAKDAQGNPYYAVGNDASGKYTVTPNFQDESGAKPAPYSPATIAAKGVNYLGKNYNTPLSDEQVSGARRTRMADLAAQGNTFASTALRDIVQTDAAMGQLKEQKELQAHREYARAAAGSFQQGGWNGFGKFATEKYNDGKTYTATEDGKGGAIIVVTDKDGKETDRTAFASPEEAIVFAVSKSDPMKWVDYKTHAADKKAERADKDRDFGLKEGALEVSRQNAKTTEQYRKDLIAERRAMTAARIAAGGAGGGGGGAPGVALKDRRDFLADTSNFLEDTKTAGTPEEAMAMQRRNEQTLAHADAIFSTNAEFGTVLTAPQARAAMQLAQDPKNVRTVRDTATGQAYETVQVNGKTVVLGVGTMKPKQAQAIDTTKPPPPARVSAPPETAIPMSYYDRAGGDANLARKLMEEDQVAQLSAALKKPSLSSATRKFMPQEQQTRYTHRTSEGQK